jgi:hypothetical protein
MLFQYYFLQSVSDSPKPRIVKCPTCGTAVVWGPQSPQRLLFRGAAA